MERMWEFYFEILLYNLLNYNGISVEYPHKSLKIPDWNFYENSIVIPRNLHGN